MRIKSVLTAVRAFMLLVVRPRDQQLHAQRFLHAAEGDTFERSLARFKATPDGARLLQSRPDSFAAMKDRNALATCEAGTFGAAYLAFMREHGLDEEYYLGLARGAAAAYPDDPERRWFRARVEGGHDLRHVVAGYGPDVLGEICLLSFRFGQLGHRGVLALAVFGVLLHKASRRGSAVRPALEAYHRGRSALLLDVLPWEERLGAPLAALRREAGLNRPIRYGPSVAPAAYAPAPCSRPVVQSADLQAGGALVSH